MSNLQKIIEENERFESFDSFFAGLSSRNENRAMYLYEKYLQKHIHSSQLRLIEGFREMVREKMKPECAEFHDLSKGMSWTPCGTCGMRRSQMPLIDNSQSLDDLLSELGSINEIK